jgi:serine/threonine protein kinase/tetratricopeptide (TPR) repeat protein
VRNQLAASLPSRFRIIRQIGEGGMGVVFEAHDEERNARVALKTVTNLNPVSLARFKREFRAVADVQHPNLVSLGELISEGEQWFFTMELVEGGDFLEYVRPSAPHVARDVRTEPAISSKPTSSRRDEASVAFAPTVPPGLGGEARFDEVRLRSATAQLASALEALHASGIAHRDVKPANIRVTAAGRVVLLDFGLAESFLRDSLTQGKMAGTPAYMAPEQAAAGAVGPAADWYAVGVLLFEALTGAVPFEGAPLAVLMEKQQDGPAPSAHKSGLPADLDALCARLLRFDPKSRASGADVLRVVGTPNRPRDLPQGSSLTNAPPFVGRAAELSTLRDAFDASHKGAVTVLIEGESGVGKTSLVRAFVEVLSHEVRDLVVLSGRCYERESVPYKALDGVVDALARFLVRERGAASAFVPARPAALAQVFPVLRRVQDFASAPQRAMMDPVEIRSLAFSSMRELFARLGERRVLVLTIDDLQWADSDSMALLTEVLRPPDAPFLLLLATMRAAALTGEITLARTAVLRDLRRLPGDLRHVTLSPLPQGEARELAEILLARAGSAAGSGRHDAAELIAKDAEGHPFFIDALARHAATLTVNLSATGVGPLQDALWSNVRTLEPAARRIVELLCIAAAPVPQDALAAAAGVEPDAFGRYVARLRVAHLITGSGVRGSDTAEPYHDRIRAAVLARLDAAARAQRHRELAQALEATESVDYEGLALHWREAGDARRAADYAVRAAEKSAAALAFDPAIRLYEIALELGTYDADARRDLLEKLGDALTYAGRGKRAAKAYEESAAGAPIARSLDLERRAAEQLVRSGHLDEGMRLMERVLRSIGMRMPQTAFSAFALFLVLRVLVWMRGLRFRVRDVSELAPTELTRIDICFSLASNLVVVDTIRGQVLQVRNLRFWLRSGDRLRISRALSLEACYVGRAGGPAAHKTEALVERAQQLANESGAVLAIAWALAARGTTRYLRGRYKEGLEDLEKADAAISGTPGTAWERDSIRLFLTNCLAQLGALGRVARETPRYVEDAKHRGDVYLAANLRIGLANLAWLAMDRPEAALGHINAAMSEWSKSGFHLEHFYELVARTNALLYAGRVDEAHANISRHWRALQRSLIPVAIQSVRVYALTARGRAALALAERDDARRAELLRDVERAARGVIRERMPWATPGAQLLRAGVARVRGDIDGAAALLRSSTSGFDAADMALHAAASRGALGELLGGDEGRALVDQAESWMRSESVKNPARMSAMIAPGFAKRE